jgi:hypothetical protein
LDLSLHTSRLLAFLVVHVLWYYVVIFAASGFYSPPILPISSLRLLFYPRIHGWLMLLLFVTQEITSRKELKGRLDEMTHNESQEEKLRV